MVSVRFRIDLAAGASLGPGKIALLEAISATGSLSAAARQLQMSYRRAWLLLDSLNHSFTEPATTATVGGRGGGGVSLTPFGRELVARYRQFEAAAGKLAIRQFGNLVPRPASGRDGNGRRLARGVTGTRKPGRKKS